MTLEMPDPHLTSSKHRPPSQEGAFQDNIDARSASTKASSAASQDGGRRTLGRAAGGDVSRDLRY